MFLSLGRLRFLEFLVLGTRGLLRLWFLGLGVLGFRV